MLNCSHQEKGRATRNGCSWISSEKEEEEKEEEELQVKKNPPHFQVVERGEEGKGFLFQLWGGREGGEEESPLLNMQSLERKQAY